MTIIRRYLRLFVWLLALAVLGLASGIVSAQEEVDPGQVTILSGRVEPGAGQWYLLPELKQGDELQVYVKHTSGNLDPFTGLVDSAVERASMRDLFYGQVDEAIAAGRDPLTVIPEFSDQFFRVWDDDSGAGYDATFSYSVPEDGDYQMFVVSRPGENTFGEYQLFVGLNLEEKLTTRSPAAGDPVVHVDTSANFLGPEVQEILGTLSEDRSSSFGVLRNMKAGSAFFAYVEATSGGLTPKLVLRDFGGKALAFANIDGSASVGKLQYAFSEDAANYRLSIEACCEGGEIKLGDFRLLVGINSPDVLTGEAFPTTSEIIHDPIDVKVGIQMDQITGVDQKSENFGVAATIRMEWTDPSYAFSPADCNCRFKTFTGSSFDSKLAATGLTWPEFILFNQQGRRDTQSRTFVIEPNGHTIYNERFSVTLQAPDFDFKLFPFDTQVFYIRHQMIFPREFYRISELEGFTGLGEQLGEEEWVITDSGSEITAVDNVSRYSFRFKAKRHLTFYATRIFLPVIIIIIVSWFTFFLKDYGKRVDVASANLLLFIAFNFTISDSLPRLGYLTFMDIILVSTFAITALVVVFNVWLKRLEVNKKESVAHTIDKFSIWLYPILYVIGFFLVSYLFPS